jgi:cytochrome-b5 reductase
MHHALSPTEFRPFILSAKLKLSNNVYILRFLYPAADDDSGCKCGEYLSTRAIVNNEPVIRYYSPLSIPDDVGHIDLLVKIDKGIMSQVFSEIQMGDTLDIRGPISGFVYVPDTVSRYCFIAGGTGISPCLQIIRQMEADKTNTPVTMLYGANEPSELVLREELDNKEHVKVIYTVDRVNEDEEWKGRIGYISKDMITDNFPAPNPDIKIIMCGPYSMLRYLKPLLESLGYSDQLYVYG